MGASPSKKTRGTVRNEVPLKDDPYKNPNLLVGVTIVDDQIFTLYDSRSFVLVYDLYNLADKPRITIPNMNGPRSIAGCSHNKALYISDWKSQCIYRVNLIDNTVRRWTIQQNHEVWGLSVTSEHNLLVTLRKWPVCRVMEYTSDGQYQGKPIRDIILDSSIDYAWLTLKLSSDQFIICHGGISSHRICIINSEGQIIKSYGGKGGAGEGQLNEPRSMTIDYNRGHVFVADRYNDRVLMFNKDLNLLNEVSTRNGHSKPTSLCFDSGSDRLYVGEYFTARVLIICPVIDG